MTTKNFLLSKAYHQLLPNLLHKVECQLNKKCLNEIQQEMLQVYF